MFRVLGSGGTAIVVGATDVGKTTFCLALANAGAVQGRRCAVVDGDLGQSEIGPPGTVGWGSVDAPAGTLAEVDCRDMFFVGSTSPSGRMLQMVVALEQIHASAGADEPYLTIVDMPGLAVGPAARALFEAVVPALRPASVVMLSRGDELAPLRSCLRGLVEPEVLSVPAAPNARVRSREERAARRRLKLAAYFAGADTVSLDAGSVGIVGTSLFCGRPAPMDVRLQLAADLSADVLHAEETDEHVLVVASKQAPDGAERTLSGLLNGRALAVVAPQLFLNIMVGLADDRGRHRAVGIVERIDFRAAKLICRTPLRHPAMVRQVVFGAMRIRPDGTELGRVDPADLYVLAGGRTQARPRR